MVSHTIDSVLGPIVLGTNINFFLFGIVLYQFASYVSHSSALSQLSRQNPYAVQSFHYKPDPWPVKAIVYFLMILDTFHTAVCGYMQWQYTIDHFGDPEILQIATWPFSITPIVTILASVTVQCFLAWRIRIITRRNLYFVIIVTFSIIQGLAGLGTGIGALWVADISRFYQLEPVAGVWFCAQVVCDMLITTTLVLTLNRERTGFKHTDNMINRLIQGAVETAVFATIFCVLDMAMFFAESGNNLHLAFALPMGRIYSNTLLATLNSRHAHREMLAAGDNGGVWAGSHAANGAARRGWAEVAVRRGGAGSFGLLSASALAEKMPGEGIKVSVTHDIELSACAAPSTPSTGGSSTLAGAPIRPTSIGATAFASGPHTAARSILILPIDSNTPGNGASSPAGSGNTELDEIEDTKSRFSESVYSLHDVDLSEERLKKAVHKEEAEKLEKEIVKTLNRMPSGVSRRI